MTEPLNLEVTPKSNLPRCIRRWVVSGVLLAGYALRIGLAIPQVVSGATTDQSRASSEFRQESNGRWLFIDGMGTPAIAGVVYQRTEGDRHIRDYTNSLHSLFNPLNEERLGGQGHGGRLAHMGIQAIRVYELPVENN